MIKLIMQLYNTFDNSKALDIQDRRGGGGIYLWEGEVKCCSHVVLQNDFNPLNA